MALAPLVDALQMGYRIGILQASKGGYNVYRRLGFQDFGNLSVYLWENNRSSDTEIMVEATGQLVGQVAIIKYYDASSASNLAISI